MMTMTGTRIGHYDVGPPLGSGGMGTVYRAVDTRLGRSVALKFLQPRLTGEEHRNRLLREAQAASALSSPNIAAIYDIGEHDGGLFLVMELVDGEPLAARVARGPLETRQAVEIALQVADALDQAHARGIVHRDIKSSNLMVDARGRVKVLDFGLAKFLGTRPAGFDAERTQTGMHDTVAGMVLGTFAYMSPEQARGRPVDARSDLFSLGVVLYEMVTGRLPFSGDTATEVLDQILNHEPPAIARFNYAIPPTLDAIDRKLLAKDPTFRYQSARELYIDLHAVSRAFDGGDDRGAAHARAPQPRLSTAVGAGDSSAAPLPAPVKLENAVAVMTFANITREPSDDWVGQGIAETVTADLTNVKGLAVISRAQIFDALKNLAPGALDAFDQRLAIQIGRQLGASWIVGGGYQRRGELVRITAQFVDVNTGELLRTVKVDGRMDELFDLQDKIVYELSQGLNVHLQDSEIRAIERNETESVQAYEAFSRGLMNMRMGTRDSLDRAISQFEQALAQDPTYAKAWIGLGASLNLKGSMLSVSELSLKGLEALRRATELAPALPQAHYLLGNAYTGLGQHDEAIAAIREAIRLQPESAGGHAALGRAYWYGKGMFDEGIRELEHAARLNPEGGYTFLQLALLYTLQGQYKRAEVAARRAIELQEQYVSGAEGLQIVGAHMRLGYVFYRQERYAEAIAQYERELRFLASGDHALRERTTIEVTQKLGAVYWRMGNHEEATRYFDRAVQAFKNRQGQGADDGATKYYVASVFALRGDVEQAVRYLGESLVTLKALNIARARLDPDFDPIRAAPAFRAVLEDSRA